MEIFTDYESLILQEYCQKRLTNGLSMRLTDPTPGNLKRECIAVLNDRYSRKDDKILGIFFELSGETRISDQIIRRFDRDKFKPLVNFLKKETGSTDPKNIELLAWLIDFQPRPYEFGKTYESANTNILENEKEQTLRNTQSGENKIISQHVISGKPYSKLKTIPVIAAIIILMSVGVLIYWMQNSKFSGINLTRQEKCMYWTGDHYQQVSCSQKFDNVQVVALDSAKLNHFKRITNPDTITLKAIGKVWYIKKEKKLEYYTAEGHHPVYTQLQLKPITEHIISKYILQPGGQNNH